MTAQGGVALPEVVTTVVAAKRTKHAAAAADESISSSSSSSRHHCHQIAQQHLDRSLPTGQQGEKTRATGHHEAADNEEGEEEEEEEEDDDERRVVTVTQGRAAAASAIITSVAPPGQSGLEDGEQQEEEEYAYDPYEYIRHLPLRTYAQRILLPPLKHRKPTLVLDLDETLVHSTIEPPPPGSPPPDHVFSVTLENTTYNVFVRVRPNMHRFLAEVAKLFELVVFTASQEAYAGRLLDMLDTERHIGHRLYRDACVLVEGNFVKDLDMLGRDLQHTTIVDNSPLAFAYHLDNGIPIESWFGERSDNHLLALMPFLRELARADDVRPLIRKKYAVVQNRHTTFTY